ncbi:unnamed protein product [Angiostrongylus costaricensis]|uniref:Arginine/serine-rich protein PNISR n=1 Tax=Angiostrongylus costaricensis TaxID=334426 RepID=A0A158PL70_ANGCS|nr:unnamed protein product [Angiostrongylus costaricensis]
MLGFEILSQAQQQTRGQVQQSVNELPAFPRRHDLTEEQRTTTTTSSSTTTTTATTTTEEAFPTKSTETSSEGNDNELSSKFDLLRMILSKMRENAEEMGITGDVQVHVIELKPFNNDKNSAQMPQQSIDDAFGEVAFPKRVLGPWRNEETHNDIRGNIELPWQFDRENMRPSPWSRPADRPYQWEGPQEPRWQQDNQVLYPILDASDREPQARFSPHFEKENQAPQRFLTEPFGNNAPEVIGHILGQKNAQAHMQLLQQQMQQQQWPQPWPQTPALQWPQPQPWPQVPGWEQRWDQPQQALHPMIWPPVFFGQMPPPLQQPPFQPVQLPPPPPPFQPSLGQQNQFPFPAQNQVPIFPQPFITDFNNNNNNLNNLNENLGNQKPWYMNGFENKWTPTWDNSNNKIDQPFNPHAAAAASSWMENTVAVGPHPTVSQITAEQTTSQTGHDSDGIDGFRKEEKFNIPVDMASDVAPQTVDVNAEPAVPVNVPLANAWQHAQPEAAESAPAPLVPSPSTELAESGSFLPVRGGEEMVVGQPINDAHKNNVDVAVGDYPKKFEEPFFQVDDPNSFRQ